jgi:hypothetical protein
MRGLSRGRFLIYNLIMKTRLMIVCACAIGFALHSQAFSRDDHDDEPVHVKRVDPPAAMGAMAPRLAGVDGAAAWLTWLEPAADATAEKGKAGKRAWRLRFSRFDGESWSQPRTIAQREDFFANWADVPSLMPAADGSLIAHWLQKSGDSAYAYDIVLARSADAGETWKTLGKLHDDNTPTEHGFVSLMRDGEGVRAFWLDGREMKSDGHGADDHGHGGGNMTLRTAIIMGETIGRGEMVDVRVCECCNTAAAAPASGPLIVYRDRSEQDTRDIAIVRRANGKWIDPKIVHADDWQISACPVNGPAIAAHGDRVAVAWFTAAGQHPRVRLSFSQDSGATFAAPIDLDDQEPLGRVALAMDESGTAIVCWLAAGQAHAALRVLRVQPNGTQDKPLTIAHTSAARASGFPSIALTNKRLLVVWTDAAGPSRLAAALVPLDQ